MLGYQKGDKLFFVNDNLPLSKEQEAQLMIDIDKENTAIYINGKSLGEGNSGGNIIPLPDLELIRADVNDLKDKINKLNINDNGTVDSIGIAEHNLDKQSHNDIRNALKDVSDKTELKADNSAVEVLSTKVELAEEDIDALQNDMAVFINTSKNAALKNQSNTFTAQNNFESKIELHDSDLSLVGNSRIIDSESGNAILTTINKDSNTQQVYLGLHEVWVKGPDEILLESNSIKTKRANSDNIWEEYVNIDSGNIKNYLTTSPGISKEDLDETLKHYVTTDQTIELINNHIDVSELAREIIIDAPENATEGTLTIDQLNMLQSGDSNFLLFNNEKYYLNDKGHVAGYLIYSHTGYENGTNIIKTITITISTRGWVLNTSELNNASIKYVTINQPSDAMEGTLSADDLIILQASKANKIIFDNEIYELQDTQHEAGYLIYSHVGHNNMGDFMVKCITVTIATKAWVLCATDILRLHCYNIVGTSSEDNNINIGAIVYSPIDSENVLAIINTLGSNILIPCSFIGDNVTSNYFVNGIINESGKMKVQLWSVTDTRYIRQELKNVVAIKLF